MQRYSWLLAKIGFKKCFIRKMKVGNAEPFYAQYVLKMMGVLRLQDEE